MESGSFPNSQPEKQLVNAQVGVFRTFMACVGGAFIPGLGHALLGKWDRAIVFFGSIAIMLVLGIQLHGRLFNPDWGDLFSTLKFIADAGSGLFYWIPWLRGLGTGDPTAYTYDYANVFIYVAGLLNMLVIVDAFDIALGRKR
jgi:hypothetical protein